MLGWDLHDLASRVTIHAFVRAPFDRYVRNDSNFWNASGLSVSLGANGINIQMESLRAILLGGIAFDTPHDSTAPISAADQRFKLYANIEEAKSAGFGQQIKLISYFPGSVAGVDRGRRRHVPWPQDRRGHRVGLVYDPKLDRIVAPVHYRVEAGRVSNLGQGAGDGAHQRRRGDDQARPARHAAGAEPDQPARRSSSLEVVPDAQAGRSRRGRRSSTSSRPPRSVASTASPRSASELLSKINRIDFDKIGKSLVSAAVGPRPDGQRPADQDDPGGAGEGDGRRAGHRPQARHRCDAGAEAPARDRRAAAGGASPRPIA